MLSVDKIEQIEGWLSRDIIQLLQDLCHKRPKPSDCLEVGSWKGKSAITVASCLGSNEYLHCIDTFTGSIEHKHLQEKINTLPDFKSNLKRYNLHDKVHIHIGTSQEHYHKIKKNSLGLIFIDGSHNFQDVLEDFQLLYDKLQIGGFVAFHDSKWLGVKRVLWNYIYPLNDIGIVKRIEDTTYIQKTTHSYFYPINQLLLAIQKAKQFKKRIKRKIRKHARQVFNINRF